MRLLIAEDDPKLLKSLVHIFQTNHYVADGVGDVLVFEILRDGMEKTVSVTITEACLTAY
jgi:DNA-binding response OmpR family regulator